MPGPQSVSVYQFKVVLRGISPMMWRRLLLRSDHSVADLHYAIQVAMGWSDSHLHQFHIHGRDFGVEHEGGVGFSDDPAKVHLADFGFLLRERFLYEYDFYDAWEHDGEQQQPGGQQCSSLILWINAPFGPSGPLKTIGLLQVSSTMSNNHCWN